MRRIRQVLSFAAASFAVAACVPTRDNAADPTVRPTVTIELAVAEVGPGGQCLSADTVANQITRGQCLSVRATGADPQGAETVVGYAVSLVTTDGLQSFVRIPGAGLSTSSTVTFRLGDFSTDQLRSNGRYDVLVEVADVNGHPGSGRERFLLRNTPPVAVPPGARLVPSWGGAWRTGEDYPIDLTVHFSGAGSFDADGDPLQYRWELREAPEGTDALNTTVLGVWSSSSELALVVPANPDAADGLLLELQVTDQQSVDRGVATAQLDALPAWAVEETTGKGLILDVNRRQFALPGSYGGNAAFLWNPSNLNGSNLLYRGDGSENVLHKVAVGSTNGTQAILTGAVQGIYTPPAPAAWFWVVTAPPAGGLKVHAIETSTLSVLAELADPAAETGSFDVTFGTVDLSNGNLWFGQLGSRTVTGWEFDPQVPGLISIVNTYSVPDGRLVTGIALRRPPGAASAELWLAESKDVFSGGSADPIGLIVVPDPASGTPAREVTIHYPLEFNLSLLPGLGFGLEWATSQTAWLNLFGVGMASFEACGPEGSASSVCLATLAPEFPEAFDYAMNRKTGTNLAVGIQQHTLGRIAIDGSHSIIDSVSSIDDVIGPDPSGRIWTVFRGDDGSTVVHRGAGAGIEGIVTKAPIALGFGTPTIDFSTGDLWAPSIFPAAALRYYTDGRLADTITGVFGDGVRYNFLPPNVTAPDPQTGNLWVLTGGAGQSSALMTRVYLLDPYAPRPIPGIAPAAAGSPNPVFDVGTFSEAEVITAAVAQVHGHALVILTRTKNGDGITGSRCQTDVPGGSLTFHYYLRRLFPDGTMEPAANVPGVCAVGSFEAMFGDDQVRLARDIVTGEVCVSARETYGPANAGALIARHGTALDLKFSGRALTSGGGGGIGIVARDLAAAPGQCWLGSNENDMSSAQKGRVHLAQKGTGTTARIFGSSLSLDLPVLNSVRPNVGAVEAEHIVGASGAWVGGGEEPFIPLAILVMGTNLQFGRGGSDSLPMTFDTKFVRP